MSDGLEILLHLVALRQRSGLTQTQVARRMHVTPGRVSHLEHARDPRIGTLCAYADAIGATIEVRSDK